MAVFDRISNRIVVAIGARLARHWRAALVVSMPLAGGSVPRAAPSPQQPVARHAYPGLPPFSHGDHRAERCASCHDSRERHGGLKFTTAAGCQGCHHVGPTRAQCNTCHTSERPGPVRQVAFALSVSNRRVLHPLRFAHAPHARITCVQCHAATPDHSPASVDCASCHADHHGPTTNCSACHQGSAAIAASHKLADHANCAAAGCHGQRGTNLPNTRAMCLTCHAAQQSHRPGRACNDCHRVRPA